MAGVAEAVLQIGSKLGPGGFASLQAGITMVGSFIGKITESVKELDRFATVMKSTDMQIVNFADSMAKGQVDTFKLMTQLNAMNAVSLKPTKDEFAAISKAATVFAQKTGRDATEVFQQLSDSIIRGTERGLVPFGIQLDETEDKAKAQKEALQKVTEMYGDLEVKLTNNTERLYALSNNWGTLTGVIWDFVNQGDGPLGFILDRINDALGDMATKMSNLNVTTKEYISSSDFFSDALTNNYLSLKRMLNATTEADDKVQSMLLNNILAKFTQGKFGFHKEDYTLEGLAGRFLKEQQEKDKKNQTPIKLPGGGGGGSREKSIYEQVIEQLDREQEELKKKDALQREIQLRREEELRGLLDLSLGIEASIDYQIRNEEELEEKERQRLDNVRYLSDLLGVDIIESQRQISGLHEADVVSIEKYRDAAEFVNRQLEDRLKIWELIDYTERASYQAWEDQEIKKADAFLEEMARLDEEAAKREEYENSAIGRSENLVDITDRLGSSWSKTRSQIGAIADAYEKGTEGMTKAQAAFYYIDAIIGAASEAAKAVASFAAQDYVSGALHVASAALYVTTMGIAAAHGGSEGGGSAPPAPVTATAGRYSGGYEGGRSESDSLDIRISMADSATVWGFMVDVNDRAARSGQASFKKAS